MLIHKSPVFYNLGAWYTLDLNINPWLNSRPRGNSEGCIATKNFVTPTAAIEKSLVSRFLSMKKQKKFVQVMRLYYEENSKM